MSEIRDKLIAAGVKTLNEFGYTNVDAKNILTDQIYSAFFVLMLNDNLGKIPRVDVHIRALLREIK